MRRAAALVLLAAAPAALAAQPRPRVAGARAVAELVATRPLPRGYTLAAGDMAAAPAPGGATAVAAAPAALVGWTTRRVIAAGEVLRAPAVAPPAAVRAGQPVAVVYAAEGVTLKLHGTAATDAPLGGRVAVRVDTRRRFEGVVEAPGVGAAAVRAALALLAPLALAPALAAAQPRQPAPAAPVPNAAPASTFNPAPVAGRPSLRGWTTDRREYAVGDIITVLVDDYTITTAVKDDIAQQRRSRDLGVSLSTPSGPATSAAINSRNNGNSQNRGEARRENRFQSELSVRVVAAGPNGTYQVRGTRLVDVDKGKQEVTLAGWVRAQDVSAANTVESARLADAQLTYQSPGPLGKPSRVS
jgi:flagella basal body P-ring formation protein FlgA